MILKSIFSGLFVKLVTGFDDLMIHIPIIATMTKTRRGKIAFSIGILLAITSAIILALIFASTIKLLPYNHFISASLLILLAFSIQFNWFNKPKQKTEEKLKTKKVKEGLKIKRISLKRFFKLIGIGFITAFATVIDDTIAYSALLGNLSTVPYVILGIYITTFVEIFAVIYFSRKISKIPYKKQLTVFGLIVISMLLLFKVI